jgi:DNA polymerase III subunit delta
MPTLTSGAVRKQIQSGSPDPIYLLQGEDDVEKSALAGEFVGLVEEGLQAFNVDRMHAGDMTTGDKVADGVAALVNAVRTMPMMAPRRVVIVFQADTLLAPKRESEAAARAQDDLDALFTRPETQTTLVLVSMPLDRRTRMWKTLQKHATIVTCGVLEDLAAAEQWIRSRILQQGIEIEPAAARLLGQLAGFPQRADPRSPHGDVGRLRGEVDRLLLYTLGQKKISVNDAREMAGPAALQDDWAMSNAIESGDTAAALRQLALMLDAGEAAEKILGQLGWLIRSKFPDVAPKEVRSAIEAVFRTDLDLKRSAGDARVLLERLVVELCAGKRSPGFASRRY